MHDKAGCFIIDKLQTCINRSDWLALISKVEHDHLEIFRLQYIRNKASIKTNINVVSMFETKKREWFKSGGRWQAEPNWTVIEKSFFEKIGTKTYIII